MFLLVGDWDVFFKVMDFLWFFVFFLCDFLVEYIFINFCLVGVEFVYCLMGCGVYGTGGGAIFVFRVITIFFESLMYDLRSSVWYIYNVVLTLLLHM